MDIETINTRARPGIHQAARPLRSAKFHQQITPQNMLKALWMTRKAPRGPDQECRRRCPKRLTNVEAEWSASRRCSSGPASTQPTPDLSAS